MQHRSRAFAALAGLGFVCLASLVFAKPKSVEVPSTNLVTPDLNNGPGNVTGSFIFGTGFEAGEGYNLGPIEPQKGWTASNVNSPWASVASANPYTGQRHLRLVEDTTVGAGNPRVALSPSLSPQSGVSSTVYLKLNISNDQGADYDMIGQAPSQGFVAWRVKFSFSDDTFFGPGTIYILDDPGSGLDFQNTDVLWVPGVYKELRVDLDVVAGEIRYYYDGVLIYTGTIYAADAVEQFVALTDNYQIVPTERCDIDAISVQGLNEPSVAVQQTTWTKVKQLWR